MGLIKAVVGSVVGTLSDSWKDYFVCDSLDNNTLMVKGTKRGYSGSDEVITNGSGIVVNDGQCALVVENGNVLEVAAEPGQYTFDSSISPTIFDGGMDGIRKTFEDALKDSPMAEMSTSLSVSTTSIPRRSWATCLVQRRRFRSVSLIAISVWMSMSQSE